MTWRITFPYLNDFPVITPEDIQAFEARNGLKLPQEYAAFLLEHRGAPPRLQNEQGEYRGALFPIDWGGKEAQSYGPEALLSLTFSLFEGKESTSPYRGGANLDDCMTWNEDLHPPGLLPIGTDPGNSLFLIGLEGELTGKIFFLSTWAIPSPMSFEHIGLVAPTFNQFLRSARPDDAS
ncbi:hypothetical protein CDN99_24550 [Roseateles aquatilis]|uniref:Knr4/Smi1-like domain-containing protein n=1 Tax=Roseateles aquatilis TaxID=431061 RepID=A0A246IW76_9BURK|nr:SMI1/KNR4 family protein [Roseateles aquatilis]OWQ84463.1 hypothetical protein CDN99_24550 [Roseateles aquatilis]